MKNTYRLLIQILTFYLLLSCQKEDKTPIVSTTDINSITKTSAESGGNITDEGGATIISRGVCWSTNSSPSISDNKTSNGAGAGSYSSEIIGLKAGTTYYVKAYATNPEKTGYGMTLSFTTLPPTLPIINTLKTSNITQNSATCTAEITEDGGASITTRGFCYGTNHNPTIGDTKTIDGSGIGAFSSSLTNLNAGTTYYVRAYATNTSGTGYGNELSLTTMGTISDIEGNIYKTISIGTQVWMIENLKTTKYSDGTSIPLITHDSVWLNRYSPGFCWYNNDDITYKADYGALYNWYTVNTGKLCPQGWHVPSNKEWETFSAYLGVPGVVANLIRETGTLHWISPNTSSTNESKFTGLPGGDRKNDGQFELINYQGIWWSSSEYNLSPGYFKLTTNGFGYGYGYGSPDFPKSFGFSVRCIRN